MHHGTAVGADDPEAVRQGLARAFSANNVTAPQMYVDVPKDTERATRSAMIDVGRISLQNATRLTRALGRSSAQVGGAVNNFPIASDRTTPPEAADVLQRALALHGIELPDLRANGTVVDLGSVPKETVVRLIRALSTGG